MAFKDFMGEWDRGRVQAGAGERVLDTVVLSEVDPNAHRGLPLRVQHSLATLLVMVLFVVSLGLAFGGCMSGGNLTLFLIAGIAVAVALQVLQALGASKFALRLAGAAAVALGAVSVVALPAAQAGLYQFGNQLITRYDDAFAAYVPLFPTATDASGWLFFVLAGMLCAFVLWLLLSNRLIIVLTVAVFLLSAISCWLGTGQGIAGVVLGLVAWFASWRLILNNRFLSLRSTLIALVFGVAIAALALGLGLLYQPSAAVAGLKAGIVSGVDAARYGDDTLPEGDLSQAAGMSQGTQDRLTVTYHGTTDQDLHLNGFAGATFNGQAWKPLAHDAYEGTWTGMFNWLGSRGFDPHLQRALYDTEDTAQTQVAIDNVAVDVQVTGANRRYVYAPTAVRSASGTQGYQALDGAMLAKGLLGPASYTLQVDQVDADADVAVTPAWLQAATAADNDGYLGSEAVYRSFAYDNYLDLSDDDRALAEQLFFDPATWTNEDPTTSAVISRVRAMLSTLASYSDAPSAYAGTSQVSFLSWFLEQQRQGNSAYFSTAAVMAFRAQGIPARYVEGYYAAADSGSVADGQTTYQLTSANAHAWVEVYLDGIGWSPVEVTPGFYTQPYRADQLIAVNQDKANNNSSDSEPAGALSGDTQQDQEQDHAKTPTALIALISFALVLLAVLVLAALVVGGMEAVRAHRRKAVAAACVSDDQLVAVPALFEELGRMAEASGVDFDQAHPLASTESFTSKFTTVTSGEFQRIVTLMQKLAFGCKELRPHEMRALRSFNGRIESALQPPKDLWQKVLWRYKYLR